MCVLIPDEPDRNFFTNVIRGDLLQQRRCVLATSSGSRAAVSASGSVDTLCQTKRWKHLRGRASYRHGGFSKLSHISIFRLSILLHVCFYIYLHDYLHQPIGSRRRNRWQVRIGRGIWTRSRCPTRSRIAVLWSRLQAELAARVDLHHAEAGADSQASHRTTGILF